ncbi:MAG TPA: hypothetical protein VMM36_04040 [Opitutaceae bacterium]|nr:hypothetical protein [Opitutaceae bacterium]
MSDQQRAPARRVCVFQSYRTTNVAEWMTRCMGTVTSWAREQGYDYRFLGDEFFDCLPGWYRDACRGHKWPMSDLARMITARTLLEGGYDRVMWFDADLVIFEPKALRVDTEPEFTFCREPWLGRRENPVKSLLRGRGGIGGLFSKDNWRGYYTVMNVNNALFSVGRGWMLDHYIESILHAGRFLDELPPQHMGPDMLTAFQKALRYPLIHNVGSFSDLIIRELALGRSRIPRAYSLLAGEPLCGANLCGSENIGAKHYADAVENLIATGGDVINKHLPSR